MAKGTYPVNENPEIPARDVSFKSCLCALLVFMAICLIILLVGIKWSKNSIEEDVEKEAELLGLEDARSRTTQSSQKEEFIPTKSWTTPSTAPNRSTSWTTTETTITTTHKLFVNTTSSLLLGITRASAKLAEIAFQTSTTTPTTSSTKDTTISIDEKTKLFQSTTSTYEDLDDLSKKRSSSIKDEEVYVFSNNGTESTIIKEDINNTIENASDSYRETQTTIGSLRPVVEILSTTTTAINGLNPIIHITTVNSTVNFLTTKVTTPTRIQERGQKLVDDYSNYSDNEKLEEAISKDVTTPSSSQSSTTSSMSSTADSTNAPLFVNTEQPVCVTPGCKSVASRMLSLMNHSIDPCEDFYEFSCGGMQVDNADSDTWNRLSEQLYLINDSSPSYLKKFRTFYDSCVSHEYHFDYEDRLTKVLRLVNEVGEIVDGESAKNVSLDITDLFADLILRQSLPIMDVDVDIDKQSSKFIIKLTLPKKTSILKESGRWSALSEGQKRCLDERRDQLQQRNLDLTEIHESYLTCQKNHAIYLNSIQTVVRSLGFYSHLKDKFNQTQRIQDLRTTIEWDILDHLNVLPPPNEIRKAFLFKDYTIQKVSDLQLHYSFLEWEKLFERLTDQEIDNNTLVQVYFPKYFATLFGEMRKVPKWKINNALVAIYAHDLYENLLIPQAKNNRENYCIRLTSKLFRDISSNVYMKTWSKQAMEESQKFLTKIFDQLKESLATTTQKVEWIDDNSRIPILAKLRNKISLTFNKREDLYNNETYLNLKYYNVELDNSGFIINAIKMIETTRKMLYGLQGKPYSINFLWSYFLSAHDSNPTSFYAKGLIMAPLGMIRQSVRGVPEYITLSRIGFSLAREIGHHFDPVGIQYGMTLSSGSKPSYEYFQNLMENEALLKGTRNVEQQKVNFKADAKLSANERIVDNTALRLITDVFNDIKDETLLPWVSTSFSKEKILFIATAQEYCRKIDMAQYMEQLYESELLPPSLRVENIMSTSEMFAKTFECPVGSGMNNNPEAVQFPYLRQVEDYSYENDLNDN